jgi:hypothetical protein
VVVDDLNGDGKLDLLVTNECATLNECNTSPIGGVGVLLGNGDGTFQKALTYQSGDYLALGLAVGDVNGDGKPDVAVVNECSDYSNCSGHGAVGVLINTLPMPPAVTISANPTTLWPPDGALVPVTISGAITDAGGSVNASTAAYAVKDEYGQVQPSGPIILSSGGKYSITVWLQASRDGNDKNGRKYTITVSAKDNNDQLGSASTVVTVAHDRRH